MPKTAIILGATGLTGNLVLRLLLTDVRYDKIIIFTRKPISVKHKKIVEHIIDLLDLNAHKELFKSDEVFCCIGTTKSKTPDLKIYKSIDYGIPIEAAQLCKENAINTFIVISALGANHKSIFFYNRIKGQMEEALISLNIPKTHILQPSLIEGQRNEKRIGETFFKGIMKLVNPLLIGSLKKYRSISAQTIAESMVCIANQNITTKRILSHEIQFLKDNHTAFNVEAIRNTD